MHVPFTRSWVHVLTLALLTGCSGSKEPMPGPDDGGDSSTVSRTIGSNGGEVALGQVRLVVPSGALSQDVTISITETEEGVPTGYLPFSKVYRFEPAGTQFGVPVQLELPFTGDATLATIFFSREGAPGFEALPTRVDANKASTSVSHFSRGFVAATTGVWNQSQWNSSTWQ